MNDIKEEIKEPETAASVTENADNKQFGSYYQWTVEEIKKLIELYNQGIRTTDIANELGIPKEKVRYKISDLKRSDKWKMCFHDRETISETETVAEPVTNLEEVREISPIKNYIKDLKVYFADFVIEECKREIVPDAVELIGAYLKYLEEKVNSNE